MIPRTHRKIVGGILVLLVLVPVPKSIIDEWSVRVFDEDGVPVAGMRVWESWENFTFQLSGWSESYTNSKGEVVFPAQKRFAPLMYWAVRGIWNVVGFGVHAGFGTVGRVWIADEKLREVQTSDPRLMFMTAANCSDGSCTARRLESQFRVPARYLDSNQGAK